MSEQATERESGDEAPASEAPEAEKAADEAADEAEETATRPRLGPQKRVPWGRLVTLFGGLATALTVILGAGSFLVDLRSQDVELEAAEVEADATRMTLSPIAEYVYWLGPPSAELSGPSAGASMPEEFRSFRVVQTPGDWTSDDPNALVAAVDPSCDTTDCRRTVGGVDRVTAAHRVVWLVIINRGATPMQSISIEWSEVDADPTETTDPFGVVRNNGTTEGEPESLVDLSPGDGLVVPLASVLRLPALGTVSTVPLGQARIPVALRFTMLGESEEQRVGVRGPADVLITGGYELDDDEVFIGGG